MKLLVCGTTMAVLVMLVSASSHVTAAPVVAKPKPKAEQVTTPVAELQPVRAIPKPKLVRFMVVPNSGGPVVRDNETGRQWVRAPSATKYTFQAAKTYCDGLTLGGHSDWRLPRIEELRTIVSQGDRPLPDGHPFNPAGTQYWSSTLATISAAHSILLTNGGYFTQVLETQHGAWCVRGGGNTAYPGSNPRFTASGTEVVDTQTQRTWKRNAVAQDTWYAVRRRCHTYGPEWRLATRSEFEGLIDMTAAESPKLPHGHPFANAWAPYDSNPEWTLNPTTAAASTTVRLSDGSFASQSRLGGQPRSGRCIKGNLNSAWPLGPVGRFVVTNSGDSVLDQETRLLWEKAPDPTPNKWTDIATRCAGLTLGGLGEWRLPTVEEFQSLIDLYVQTQVKLPGGHPFTVTAGDYWTSTNPQYNDMRTLKLATGGLGQMSKGGGNMLGWCMRPAP